MPNCYIYGCYWDVVILNLPQNINSELISSILLYILIFLVESIFLLKIQFLTLDHIKVPIFTILALFISAYITTFF
jgi:hypothetical protein